MTDSENKSEDVLDLEGRPILQLGYETTMMFLEGLTELARSTGEIDVGDIVRATVASVDMICRAVEDASGGVIPRSKLRKGVLSLLHANALLDDIGSSTKTGDVN